MANNDKEKPDRKAVPLGEGLTPEQEEAQAVKSLTLTTDGKNVTLAWHNLNNLEMEMMLQKALEKIKR